MECERKKDVVCEIMCLDIKCSSTDSMKMLVFKFSNNMNKDKNGKMIDGNGMGVPDEGILGIGPGSGGGNFHASIPAVRHDNEFAYCKQDTESSRGIPAEEH